MVLTCCFRFLKHKLKVLNKEKKVKKKKRHEKIETYRGFNSIDIGEGIAFTVTDTQIY